MMPPIRNDISSDDRHGADAGQLDLPRRPPMPRKLARPHERCDRTPARCRRACAAARRASSQRPRARSRRRPRSSVRRVRPHRRLVVGERRRARARSARRAPASAPRQSTRPPPSADAPLERWRAGRRRPYRAPSTLGEVDDELPRLLGRAARRARCSLCSSARASSITHSPAGQRNSRSASK